MESGRFAALIVIMVALVGGAAYLSYEQILGLQGEVERLQTQAANAAATANQARTAALDAKSEADKDAAAVAKLPDAEQMAKQASDTAASAQKEADDAKQAVESTRKTRR